MKGPITDAPHKQLACQEEKQLKNNVLCGVTKPGVDEV
jgi:hypothetical protein